MKGREGGDKDDEGGRGKEEGEERQEKGRREGREAVDESPPGFPPDENNGVLSETYQSCLFYCLGGT